MFFTFIWVWFMLSSSSCYGFLRISKTTDVFIDLTHSTDTTWELYSPSFLQCILGWDYRSLTPPPVRMERFSNNKDVFSSEGTFCPVTDIDHSKRCPWFLKMPIAIMSTISNMSIKSVVIGLKLIASLLVLQPFEMCWHGWLNGGHSPLWSGFDSGSGRMWIEFVLNVVLCRATRVFRVFLIFLLRPKINNYAKMSVK